jgi:hypothetical protein
MRACIVVVVLLLSLSAGFAFAADPPGGPGWYQVIEGFNVSTTKGILIIAADTPGFLKSATSTGMLSIQFERGIATWLGREITAVGEFATTLTITVKPSEVRALLKQPLSKATPPGPGGSPSGFGGGSSGSGGGSIVGTGNSVSAVTHHETVAVTDTQEVRIRSQPLEVLAPPSPDSRRPGGDVFRPPASSSGSAGAPGRPGRVIAQEDHEAWLAKVLRLLGEEDARCQTKAYGPGWISICDPRREPAIAALR